MYLDCVKLGIPAEEYWSYTFEELMIELEAIQYRREAELKEKATFDYRLVELIGFAVNDPQKMPKRGEAYEILQVEDTRTQQEKDEANLQKWLALFDNFEEGGEENGEDSN
ncbi:MAG: hypothetical protein LBV67_11175 [Streptococcaceae bacterium]|jgi:hypothetical protein|nr:hypothetical protein [Streptococcaceae bacterium]